MASNADMIIAGLLQGTGFGRTVGDFAQQNAQTGLMQQRLRAGEMEFAAMDQAARQQAAYQQWAQTFRDNPSPQKLFEGATLFPEQAKQLADAWKLKDDAVRQADQSFFGQAYAVAKGGRKNMLMDMLKNRRDAERARGIDTSELDSVINDVEAGEEGSLEAVQSYALAHIYGSDPGNFLKVFGLDKKAEGPKVLGYGDALVNPDGSIVYQAPDAPFTLSEGQARYANPQPGGGDPGLGAGGASAPSGQFTGGWTPRARNGGDNPDNVVDNKISGMANFLGLGADDPFPAGLSNMQIAQALTLSEGGAGSLADRNNNPGNLIDPKTGGFRKFPNKEAGLRAAAAQVARNRSRGQNSIRTMVEGRPVGGQGGAQAVASRPKAEPEKTRILTASEVAALGLDPALKYQQAANGTVTLVGGQDTRTRPGRAVPDGTAKRVETNVAIRDGLQRAVQGFQDDFAGNRITGGLESSLQGVFGTGTPGQRDWWADFRSLDNQVRNDLFGAALTATEKAAYEATTISERMNPAEVRKNLKRRLEIVTKALNRQQNFLKKNGYNAEAVDSLFANDALNGAQQAAPSGFRILRVRPK